METPLDVLSRAATLVETDRKEGEVGYSTGGCSDSPKELPSRVNRQRRSVERREGPLVMKCDGDHAHRTNGSAGTSTRCASTQTLITSEMVGIPEINPDLPIPSSSSLMSEDDPLSSARHHHHPHHPHHHHHHHGALPVLPHPHHPHHPIPHHSHRHHRMPAQLQRPSVITCAPAPGPLVRGEPPNGRMEVGVASGAGIGAPLPGAGPLFPLNGRAGSHERWSAGAKPQPSPSSSSSVSASKNSDVDPDIEEHFRRSLGQNYQETYSSPPPSATTPPTSSSPSTSPTTARQASSSTSPTFRQSSSSPSSTAAMSNPNEISITGSVDDHFAKALGEKWSQIKDVIEPSTSERSSPSSSPSLRVSSPPVIQQQQASVAS